VIILDDGNLDGTVKTTEEHQAAGFEASGSL
jgi:hypothetical protein